MSYNKRILSEIDRELKDRYRSKRYSKSLAATNSLFAVNDLFAKPSRRRIYNPNAQYFQHGGSHDPPQESAEGQKDWMMNYIQSPMYLKRLSKEFPDYSNEDLEAERNARLSNVKNVNIKYPRKPIDPRGYGNTSGVYYPKNIKPGDFSRRISTGELVKDEIDNSKSGNLYLETPYRADMWFPEEGYNTIPLHEIGHAADDGGSRIPYKTEKFIYDSTNKAYAGPMNYDVLPWDNATKVINELPFKYKNTPTEFVNRLIPLRYELERAGIWKPGEEDFIDGMYNLMLKNPDVMKNTHIQDVLDEIPGGNESRSKRAIVTKLLNEIALSDVEQDLNVAKHGGSHGGPNAQYFQGGGPINTSGPRAEEAPVDEDAMNAMMKSRLAYEYEKGNPAAKRMVAPVDNPYDFGDGRTGTHYMSSYDNYAIPEIQDVDGTLEMTGPRDNEAIRFDREEDARYFANENYKRVSPMFINAELDDKEIQKYVDGGYVVEEMAEGGGVEVESCPPGQAWNGKYCVKIKNIVSDGKKVRVVPTPYEVENPSDDPLTQEFQSIDVIDSTIKQGKKEGYSDDIIDKMICQKGDCHFLTIDDDTEIENIEPVKKRRTVEEIYPEVDHDKYPTIEDFDFAVEYYKENGEDPSDDLLPSNRVEEEPEVEPEVEEELDIEPLPVIEPDPIINDIPEPIIENEIVEDELPSAEEFYADSLPVTNSEGEIVLPYEETTGKYRKERRGTRRPGTKNRSWDGVKGNLQRIFTDKEYSGPWFPNKKIKQEGGVPEFQGGGVAKALSKAANKTRSQVDLLKKINPQLSKVIPKFVANSLDNQLTGINRGGRELLSKFTNAKDSRKFSEIFPITKSQQKAADLLQEGALKEGVDFAQNWFYKFDPKLGMALRPEISDKILDLYEFSGSGKGAFVDRGDKYFAQEYRDAGKRLGEIDQPLDNTLQYSNSKAGLNQYNPFIQTRNILTGRGRSILNDASLSENQKIALLKTRLEDNTNGVNYSHDPDMRLSTTDSNFGRFRKPSNEIMETGLHETTHTAQNLGRGTKSFGNILSKWDPDREYYYANKDNPIGQFFSEIMPDKDWVGSPNELHAELMVARKRAFDSLRKDPKVKEGFKRDFETGRTLGIDERDNAIEEWALGELRNPSNTTLDGMIENKNLDRFFKEGTSKEKKYQALRYLPGLAVPFALPGLTDDDKPKLQKGGALELGDEVTQDMVEELRRQGYTIEEI